MPDIKKKKKSSKSKLHKMIKNNDDIKKKVDSIYDFYVKPKFYIFQIGFNRCATQSLHQSFLKIGIKSIHFRWVPSKTCSEQKLAVVMYDNLCNPEINNKILHGSLSTYQAFSDMEYIYEDYSFNFYTYFKDMENQNHGSKFIMNIRNCEDWLRSRIKLGGRISNNELFKSDYYKSITDKQVFIIDYFFNKNSNSFFKSIL